MIVIGAGRGIREVKDLESKHIYFEAPESMIQVLELKTEKHEPKYCKIVPAIAPALNPVAKLLPCLTLISLATCSTKLAY